MAKVNKNEEIREEVVKTTVSAAESFFSENRKLLLGVILAVLVIGLGVLGYSRFIYAPAVSEAQAQSFVAEMNFQAGEWDLALNGDGVNPGFAAICDEYGSKAGKAVYLYAATCCAQLGQWPDALAYVKKYKGKEPILAARALALQGDCHLALENPAEAVKCYERAAAKADNIFAAEYLVKAGRTYMVLGQNDKALAAFQSVKDKYPMSIDAATVDKYINSVAK